jgi:hypothetical protein
MLSQFGRKDVKRTPCHLASTIALVSGQIKSAELKQYPRASVWDISAIILAEN